MKISVLQQDLLPSLQTVSRSVGVRSTLPVLDNILLVTEGSKLKLAATNLEIGVIKYTDVEVIEAGEITVPAKTFVELISSLGPLKIDIESKSENVTVSAGKFKADINCIPSAEFPVIPLPKGEGIILGKEVLLSSSQIIFAAAVDEGRPTLTGVLTEIKNDRLGFIATDGFRLAHRQVKLEKSYQGGFKVLIPKRTYEEVIKIISEDKADDVAIFTTQNQIIFSIGSTTVSSRLIEGQFPAWEKIIPQNIITRVMVDKEDLMKAIKLAAIFARNEANIVVLKTSKEKVILQSSTKELGSQQNEVDGTIEGENIEIAFNTKFLQDAVLASSASQLMLEFSGPLSPTLIKPIGIEGLEYIVMPVRLN